MIFHFCVMKWIERLSLFYCTLSLPGGSASKESTCNGENLGSILCLEDSLEKGTATSTTVFWVGQFHEPL